MTHLVKFIDAIRDAGLVPPDDITADGVLRRFSGTGNKRDNSCWYVLYADGIPAGKFGDWKSGLIQSWCDTTAQELTAREKAQAKAKVAALMLERKAKLAQSQKAAAAKALQLWAQAGAEFEHPYLIKKGAPAFGVRMLNGALVIPMRENGELHSLQTISADGVKKFLFGGRISGCYHSIGLIDRVICICEGYATGASIHQATGYAVAVAFNAGNLPTVAKSIRLRYPDMRIVICADDDWLTTGNPGLTKAKQAATVVNGAVAVPGFESPRADRATDFNDMCQAHGAIRVARVISQAATIRRAQVA